MIILVSFMVLLSDPRCQGSQGSISGPFFSHSVLPGISSKPKALATIYVLTIPWRKPDVLRPPIGPWCGEKSDAEVCCEGAARDSLRGDKLDI